MNVFHVTLLIFLSVINKICSYKYKLIIDKGGIYVVTCKHLKSKQQNMENYYLCPFCRGHLRVGENIVFKVRNTFRETGLLLLQPNVGNYTSIIHPKFHVEGGERIDFFCPLCMRSLDASLNENMVHVIMVDSRGTEHEVYFSSVAGENNTFKVSSRELNVSGNHSYRYTPFTVSDKSPPLMHN